MALVFFIVYHFVAVRRWPIFTARRYFSAVYAVVVCLVRFADKFAWTL